MKMIGTVLGREMVAVLKVIDNDRWKTIGVCLDTPVALNRNVKKLNKIGYKNIWKKSKLDLINVPLF